MKYIVQIVALLFVQVVVSQVKIGDKPYNLDSNSILELESSDKVLVITRMNNSQMLAIRPKKGALVYNTQADCVYTYDGNNWKSLCEATATTGTIKVTTQPNPPTNNRKGDFWINNYGINNNTNNTTNIYDGQRWVAISSNPRAGTGVPNQATAPNPKPGDIYVNKTNANIYAYNGTNWIKATQTEGQLNITGENAITVTQNKIELGGTLTKPTTIKTNDTNTLAIEGLKQGDVATDNIVTIDTQGRLGKAAPNSLFSFREEVAKWLADTGQRDFKTPLPITDSKKINVYRNGIRVDFTVVNNETIKLEQEAVCYKDDEIRIVQFY